MKILAIIQTIFLALAVNFAIQAAPVSLVFEYATSGQSNTRASGYIIFRDQSFLLNGYGRDDYWMTYPQEWNLIDTGISFATMTVESSLENAGQGTFTHIAPDSGFLKDFYWKFNDPENIDLSADLKSQMDHFMWDPASEGSVGPEGFGGDPHTLEDYTDISGSFNLITNDFGCWLSVYCHDYELVYGGTYPYGKPETIYLELTSITLSEVPVPASIGLFVAGILMLFGRKRMFTR